MQQPDLARSETAVFSHRLQPVVIGRITYSLGAGFSRPSRLKGFIHAGTCFPRHLSSHRLAHEQRPAARDDVSGWKDEKPPGVVRMAKAPDPAEAGLKPA